MMNSQTVGNYAEPCRECEYLTLAFSPSSAPRAPVGGTTVVRRLFGRLRHYLLPATGAVPAPGNHRAR